MSELTVNGSCFLAVYESMIIISHGDREDLLFLPALLALNLQVPQAFTIEYYLAIKEEAEDDDEVRLPFETRELKKQYPAGWFN